VAHHEITFPTDEATIRELHAGDTVTIQGHIIGIRDATQIRIFDKGQEPPFSLDGAALLHTAPNVRKRDDGGYEPMCIGTTTSARMSRFTEGLIRDHGSRAIIGKGGLLPAALEPLREHGGVYLAIVGGGAGGPDARVPVAVPGAGLRAADRRDGHPRRVALRERPGRGAEAARGIDLRKALRWSKSSLACRCDRPSRASAA
jgi:tartrate dehydratase beta subunit/fumarate hydratase class I family protein